MIIKVIVCLLRMCYNRDIIEDCGQSRESVSNAQRSVPKRVYRYIGRYIISGRKANSCNENSRIWNVRGRFLPVALETGGKARRIYRAKLLFDNWILYRLRLRLRTTRVTLSAAKGLKRFFASLRMTRTVLNRLYTLILNKINFLLK